MPTADQKITSEGEAIVVDLNKCLACKGCEIECALVHSSTSDIEEEFVSGSPLVPRVRVIAAAGRAVPLQCQQCEDAPCVEVCPSGALYKDEITGRTLTAVEKCIGCKSCIFTCPFGAVEWNNGLHRLIKCDLCEGVIERGEQPACVTGCPTGARSVRKMAELSRQRRKTAAERTVRVMSESREEESSSD